MSLSLTFEYECSITFALALGGPLVHFSLPNLAMLTREMNSLELVDNDSSSPVFLGTSQIKNLLCSKRNEFCRVLSILGFFSMLGEIGIGPGILDSQGGIYCNDFTLGLKTPPLSGSSLDEKRGRLC
ncbi:hypothetical protein AMTRI_Chr11g155410 [Amborella trichopoda]